MIYLQKKICLSCRKFRLEDPQSGVCRLVKSSDPYPMKLIEDSCEQWVDAGQQYYIRTGWIKKTLTLEKKAKE